MALRLQLKFFLHAMVFIGKMRNY